MKLIRNILVGLDLSYIDENLIKYASFLADKLGIEKVYFVHNIKKYEISEVFEEQLKSVNLEELITDEIEEKISKNFSAKAETDILISEDPYTESLINYIVNKYMIDLVVIGNKHEHGGTGVVPDKLLRLLNCHIVSVPPKTKMSLEKVWVGTDFSRESKKAFNVAEYLHDEGGSNITAAHIYHLPIQFAPFVNHEEVIPKIEKHTKTKFERYLSGISLKDLEWKTFRGRDASISTRLATEAERAGVNMILVTDKGGNVISNILVGSVTDELFSVKLAIPLWVVK